MPMPYFDWQHLREDITPFLDNTATRDRAHSILDILDNGRWSSRFSYNRRAYTLDMPIARNAVLDALRQLDRACGEPASSSYSWAIKELQKELNSKSHQFSKKVFH
jgi:hypothetical protein